MQVERKAMEGLLEQIRAERSGEPVDRQLLQHLLRMLSSLGVSWEGEWGSCYGEARAGRVAAPAAHAEEPRGDSGMTPARAQLVCQCRADALPAAAVPTGHAKRHAVGRKRGGGA